MKKLTDNEFADFYYKNVYPIVNNFENERQKLCNKLLLIGILALIPAVFFLIFFGTVILIVITLFVIWIEKKLIKNYQKTIKEYVYKDIFKQFDLNYSNYENEKILAENLMHNVCEKSQIFNGHDNIYIDDMISGTYNNLPIKIFDAEVYYMEGSGKSRHKVIPFLGIFLATKINKKLACETLIKSEQKFHGIYVSTAASTNITFDDNQISVTHSSTGVFANHKKQHVKLEDVEFEKYFEVYSDDQIEGRYLLTPAFINRLLEYRKKKNYTIEIFFSNQMGMEENVFLFIHNNKDNFELPIFKKIDKDGFYNVIKEIYDALEIIDALKLEQNIGM